MPGFPRERLAASPVMRKRGLSILVLPRQTVLLPPPGTSLICLVLSMSIDTVKITSSRRVISSGRSRKSSSADARAAAKASFRGWVVFDP
jgi:hypothetical protein